MKRDKQTDLSSSEDEASISILREAIDHQFLSNDLYNIEKSQVIPFSTQTNKLRTNSSKISSKQEDRFINFGVTATFQSFIAKKLDEILEQIIELESNEITNYCGEQKRKRNKKSGIKLLSTSKKLLNVTKVKKDYTKHKKRSKRNREIVENDEDASSKFREAAVDPEHLLSKLDTKAWVNKRPEPEFKYKRLKNGTLIEI